MVKKYKIIVCMSLLVAMGALLYGAAAQQGIVEYLGALSSEMEGWRGQLQAIDATNLKSIKKKVAKAVQELIDRLNVEMGGGEVAEQEPEMIMEPIAVAPSVFISWKYETKKGDTENDHSIKIKGTRVETNDTMISIHIKFAEIKLSRTSNVATEQYIPVDTLMHSLNDSGILDTIKRNIEESKDLEYLLKPTTFKINMPNDTAIAIKDVESLAVFWKYFSSLRTIDFNEIKKLKTINGGFASIVDEMRKQPGNATAILTIKGLGKEKERDGKKQWEWKKQFDQNTKKVLSELKNSENMYLFIK